MICMLFCILILSLKSWGSFGGGNRGGFGWGTSVYEGCLFVKLSAACVAVFLCAFEGVILGESSFFKFTLINVQGFFDYSW